MYNIGVTGNDVSGAGVESVADDFRDAQIIPNDGSTEWTCDSFSSDSIYIVGSTEYNGGVASVVLECEGSDSEVSGSTFLEILFEEVECQTDGTIVHNYGGQTCYASNTDSGCNYEVKLASITCQSTSRRKLEEWRSLRGAMQISVSCNHQDVSFLLCCRCRCG